MNSQWKCLWSKLFKNSDFWDIYLNTEKAKSYIVNNARPLVLSLYKYCYEDCSKEHVLTELKKFQNLDGGFDISWQ